MNNVRCLRVFNQTAIEELFLVDLGQINLICGPNNSGKSTVLQAVFSGSDKCETAIKLDSERIEVISEDFRKEARLIDRYFNHKIANTLKDAASNLGSLGQSQVEDLVSKFRSRWVGDPQLRGEGFPEHAIRGAVQGMFEDFPGLRLLIPEKRHVNSRMPLAPVSGVNGDGSDLLRWLAAAHNSEESDEKNKQYVKLRDVFQTISAGFEFRPFEEGNMWELKMRRIDTTEWHMADQCGMGLRDLLIILYW